MLKCSLTWKRLYKFLITLSAWKILKNETQNFETMKIIYL